MGPVRVSVCPHTSLPLCLSTPSLSSYLSPSRCLLLSTPLFLFSLSFSSSLSLSLYIPSLHLSPSHSHPLTSSPSSSPVALPSLYRSVYPVHSTSFSHLLLIPPLHIQHHTSFLSPIYLFSPHLSLFTPSFSSSPFVVPIPNTIHFP
jgi:hypothetical protein